MNRTTRTVGIYFDEKFLRAGVDVEIPLPYYFDFFAQKRLKKYWLRFVEQMRDGYGKIFSEDFLRRLESL